MGAVANNSAGGVEIGGGDSARSGRKQEDQEKEGEEGDERRRGSSSSSSSTGGGGGGGQHLDGGLEQLARRMVGELALRYLALAVDHDGVRQAWPLTRLSVCCTSLYL